MDTTDVELLRAGLAGQIADADAWPTWRDRQKLEVFRELVSDKFTDEQIAHSYFKLPTGYGKTVMFARMARAYFDALIATGTKKHQKIVIIVPRLSLIEQTQKKLEKFANITATEYSGQKKNINSDVVITTYNSLVKLFGVVDFNDVALIFADEAHHMLGAKISEQLTFYNQFVPIIGFTATPEYEANRAVTNMLNTEIFAMDIPKAVKIGVLSPVKNILYRSSIVCDLSNVPATSTGDYDYEKITTKISPETLATEIARIYADGFDKETGTKFSTLKAIINCPTAAIANLQAAKINEIMGRDVAISLHKVGISDKEYDRLKEDFEDGKYTVACQVGTLTEGFDDVTVSMCINYPTRSRVKAEQTAGRAIRIDENNPDKIAFVLDTIFRATKNEAPEEILYTASNSHQVLFKDIAEGNIVLYPKDFQRKTNTGTRTHGNIEFVDFDLITDSTTLIELNRRTEERIADEFIPEKTDEWLSVNDLVSDKEFPSSDWNAIDNAWDKLQDDPELKVFLQKRQSVNNGKIAKCVHESKKQLFADKAEFKLYLPKTKEWLSVNELVHDKEFPSSNWNAVDNAWDKLQNDPALKGFLQKRLSYSQIAKCVHESKKQLFADKAEFKLCPQKTKEWLSINDLASDKEFPSGDWGAINDAWDKLQNDPELKDFIQKRKTHSNIAKCVHESKKQAFAKKAGFLPQKTAGWSSIFDLARDKEFPSSDRDAIDNAWDKLQDDPVLKDFLQKMKIANGQIAKCVHESKKQLFADKAEFKLCPQKTKEWLSINDLASDKEFPSGDWGAINDAWDKLQNDPALKGFLQKRLSYRHIAKCVHESKKQLFADKAEFKSCPQKTKEWLSINDLASDKEFPSGNRDAIDNAWDKLQDDPELKGFLQKRQSVNGKIAKCVHESKKQLFADKAGFTQKRRVTQQSLQDGTKVVGAMSAVQDIENSTRPDDQHKM